MDAPRSLADAPARYRVRVRGAIEPHWSGWFAGMTISYDAGGDTLLIGMLAVSVVLGVALAPVQARPHRAEMLPRLQAELGLTDDQVQAIRQLHEGQREARKQLYRSLREARRTLREMVIDGVDDATVQQARGVWRDLRSREGVEHYYWKQEGGRWTKAG